MSALHIVSEERPILIDPVWEALSEFKGFVSATPAAFEAKAAAFPVHARRQTAVIKVDALRATTTLTATAAAGVQGIYVAIKPTDGTNPFTPPTDQFGPWVGGGERNGEPIPGGRIANSPIGVKPSMFEDLYLKFVSTNGARAIRAAENAGFDRIYLACFPNMRRTVAAAIAGGAHRIFFGAGGFYGSATLEDTVCIGLGVRALIEAGFADANCIDDEARIALEVGYAFSDQGRFVSALRSAQVSRLLAKIGHAADIEAAVTGAGIDPTIWRLMASTVLRYERRSSIGIFVPSHPLEEQL